MNKLLASVLNFINVIYAFLLILAFIYGGYHAADHFNINHYIGSFFGALVGILVAGGVCGGIALLVLIEDHLSALRDNQYSFVESETRVRVEPTLKV